MENRVKEYDAKVDAKKRIALRNTPFEYYHVSEYSSGKIVSEPRELVAPSQISAASLAMMDTAIEQLKRGNVSAPVDLSEFQNGGI